VQKADTIFKDMVAFARFPENLFTGSDARMNLLRQTISFEQSQPLR
jgi:hypothetical protein